MLLQHRNITVCQQAFALWGCGMISADTIRLLIEAGVTAEAILRVVVSIEEE